MPLMLKEKDANTLGNMEAATEKKKNFCKICKVPVTGLKNWETHNAGRKHLLKVKAKERKSKIGLNSSDKLTEKLDINDNNSFSAPNEFLSFNGPKTNHDVPSRKEIYDKDHDMSKHKKGFSNDCEVSNRNKSYFNDYELSDRKKSHASNYEVSDRKKSYSNDYIPTVSKRSNSDDYQISDSQKTASDDCETSEKTKMYSNDYDLSNGKESHSNDYQVSDRRKYRPYDYEASNRKKGQLNDHRNNHSRPIPPSNKYYYSNHEEPYNDNRNYDNRYCRWSPNYSFRGGPEKRFQPFNGYPRYNQNYNFNQFSWRANVPNPLFSDKRGMPNLENDEYFSENIQSENIQPVECSRSFETHSNNKHNNEIAKKSSDSEKSPCKKPIESADREAKKSPRIPVKVITKNTATSVDVQNKPGSEKQQKEIVLSENMTGKRLAHWINPSNQKDEAEIRRLVTEFAKSKKKENLIKLKLHTDKVHINSGGNQSEVEETNSITMTPEVFEHDISLQPSSETIANVSSNQLTDNSLQAKKRHRSCSFTSIASDESSPINIRNHSESHILDEKIKKRRRGKKRTFSNPCDSPCSRKRKESVDSVSTSKKHKCSSAECLEKCIENAIAGSEAINNPERKESEATPLTVNAASKDFVPPKDVYIKKEIDDNLDSAEMASLNLNDFIQKQTDAIASCQDDASFTPVESLINLFATGNITIKKEFDDPLIDAIRSIDPVLLDKVCEDQPDKNGSNQELVEKIIEPVIASPPVIPDSSVATLNSTPSLTLSLKNILNELQVISEEEEKVKVNLLNADQQIQHYQSLLDKWKTKKIKFQSEEEILRNKRNTLVRTMNDLVVQQSSECISTTASPEPEERPLSNSLPSTNVLNNINNSIKIEVDSVEMNQTENDSTTALQQDPVKESCVKIESEDDVIPIENDEIVVLPLPESRIPVIDLDHSHSPNKNNAIDAFSKATQSTASISENCHKIINLVAHNAVINSLQIFNEHLYTCANDKTAKRFNLKDPTKVVTYSHAEKNIVHLCVEKLRGKVYTFTSASASNLVTVFDAESALKVKVHQFRTKIANMCKGKGKIYVGLKSGIISTCDWKDQRELVYNEEPIRSLATAHQGGINILVVLSTKGNVSIRDADRNGLLIKYVKALAHVPLFMSIYNDWVYLSSAGYLSVLDLTSGTFVKKYELPAAYTSLTVYKDHIFTTSFSGFVRCYSKFDIKDVKAYYGAGKMALTCIHAHDGWVFTGNRTGEISVFKFDSESSLPCQFGKCSMIFARLDDLMYHVLQGKDHSLISIKTCLWRKCNSNMKNWDQEAIHNHLRAHVTTSFPSQHEPMYNLIV